MLIGSTYRAYTKPDPLFDSIFYTSMRLYAFLTLLLVASETASGQYDFVATYAPRVSIQAAINYFPAPGLAAVQLHCCNSLCCAFEMIDRLLCRSF